MEEFFRVDARQLESSDPELRQYLADLGALAIGGGWDVEKALDVLGGDRKAADRLEGEPLFVKRALGGSPSKFGSFVSDTDKILHALHDKVVGHYSEINAEQAATLYRPFLQGFLDWFSDVPELGRTLPVFTLNYDMAVESAASILEDPGDDYGGPPVRLVDGFGRARRVGRQWSRAPFDNYREDPEKANVVLVKLHGSVLWGRRPTSPEVIVELTPELGRNPGPFQTVILYPTEERKEIQQEPFHTGYRLLHNCLRQTHFLVVIGTSFRDAEVCEMIRDAMEDNPSLRLASIGPSQTCERVAARIGVEPEKVAAMKAKLSFPTHGEYDNAGHATDNGLMGGLRELARAAYGTKARPGWPRFGATNVTSGDGRWQKEAPDAAERSWPNGG